MKTPSSKIMQDSDVNAFQDKYYGRMPKLLHGIEEADIAECNPEYVELVNQFMLGTIPSQNLEPSLLLEIEALINIMPNDPGTRTWEDNKIIACIEA